MSIIVVGSIRELSARRDEIGSALLMLAVDVEHIVTRATTSGWIHRV